MEQKLPTSLNLNMVSWTRIFGLHQQQQYLDLASKHSEVNTVSTWTGAEGSIDPWMLLSEAEEQLFPRWDWKMVPYILYMYIYVYNVTNWSEATRKRSWQQEGRLEDFLRLDEYEFSKDYIWFTWRTGGTITPSTAVEYCWKTRRDGGSWWRRPHSARWDLRSWQPPAPWRDFPRAGPTE